jgi:hypothetical protein
MSVTPPEMPGIDWHAEVYPTQQAFHSQFQTLLSSRFFHSNIVSMIAWILLQFKELSSFGPAVRAVPNHDG